jgi:hypothetical protein
MGRIPDTEALHQFGMPFLCDVAGLRAAVVQQAGPRAEWAPAGIAIIGAISSATARGSAPGGLRPFSRSKIWSLIPVEPGVSAIARGVGGAEPFVEGPGAPGDGPRYDDQRKRECTRIQSIKGSVNAGKRRTTCMDLLLHGHIGRDSIGGNHANSEEWGTCPFMDHRMSRCARMSRKIGASLRSRARPSIAVAKGLGSTVSARRRSPPAQTKRVRKASSRSVCQDQAACNNLVKPAWDTVCKPSARAMQLADVR